MMKQFQVLVIDDEPRIIKFMQVKLKTLGYEVLTARNGKEALEQVQTQEPGLVVLDVMMPVMDGFETLKQIRSFSSVPVIVLSARGTNADKIKGLRLGADDYLAKPFSPDELVARIEAVRRRLAPDDKRKTHEEISFNGLTINFNKRRVTLKGRDISLTRIEWLLLSELAQNAGRLLLYHDLLIRVWGPEFRDDVQILRTWISRLRKKLEDDPNHPVFIRNVPKTGYIIDQPAD